LVDKIMTTYERRYHATWTIKHGRSPLALLSEGLCRNPRQLAIAPLDLLSAAATDVAVRLPMVAAREPTRRHRRHFAWLLGWHQRITSALEQGTS
jgi:hypothetical protein